MLWTFIAILVALWLLGFSFNFGGNLIHALLVIVLVVVVIQFLS